MTYFKTVKRLTLKFFIDHKKLKNIKYNDEVLNIGLFYGVLKAIKSSVGNSGEVVEFFGNFEAVNFLTGESVRFGACYLPDSLRTELVGHSYNLDYPLEICFMINARGAEKSGGYFIDCEALKSVVGFDELFLIRDYAAGISRIVEKNKGVKVGDKAVAVFSDETEQVDIEEIIEEGKLSDGAKSLTDIVVYDGLEQEKAEVLDDMNNVVRHKEKKRSRKNY